MKVEFRHTDPKRKSYNVVIFKFSNDDVIVGCSRCFVEFREAV